MGAIVLAWLVGEGLVIYQLQTGTRLSTTVKNQKPGTTEKAQSNRGTPPGPGQLLITSGLFVLLALLAEPEKTRKLAVTLAWGFDIVAFMNMTQVAGFPKVTGGNSVGGPWPPNIAPNTIIIPNGQGGSSTSNSASNISATTPVLSIAPTPVSTPPSSPGSVSA